MTLTEFLEARLAEDEALAQTTPRQKMTIVTADGSTRTAARVAEHAERWQPARALREVEAKRAILAEHAAEIVASLERDTWAKEYEVCRRCRVNMTGARFVAPCQTLRDLAAVYSDHPSFQEEWRR